MIRIYTPTQIADMTGIGEGTVRAVVRRECRELIPDALRMIPGGRVNDKVMVVYADIFDAVTGAAHLVLPSTDGPVSLIHRRVS